MSNQSLQTPKEGHSSSSAISEGGKDVVLTEGGSALKENEVPKDSSVQRVSKSEDRVSKLVSLTPGKVKSKAPQPPGSSNRINELVKGQETSNSQRASTDSSEGGGSKVSQNLSKSLDNVATEFSSSKKKGPAPVAPTSFDHRREVKSDPSHDLDANERRENEIPEEITVSSDPATVIDTIGNGRIPKPGEIVPTDDSNESIPAVVTSFHGNGGQQQQQSPLEQDTAHVSVITIDDNGKDVTIKTSNREEMTSFLSQPDGDGASGNLVADPRTATQSSAAKEVIVISNDSSSFIPHHRYQDSRFMQPNDGSLPRSVAISYDEDRISIRTESSDNSYPSSDLRGPIDRVDHMSSSIRSSDSRGNHKNGFQRTSSDGQKTRSNGSAPGMVVSKASELLHREVSDADSFASDRDRSDRDRQERSRDKADRGNQVQKQQQKQESKSTSSSFSQQPTPPDAKQQSSEVVLRRKKVRRTFSQFDLPHHIDRFSSLLLSRSSAFSILRVLSSIHFHPAHSLYLPRVLTPTQKHFLTAGVHRSSQIHELDLSLNRTVTFSIPS